MTDTGDQDMYNLSDSKYGTNPFIVWIGGSFSPPTIGHLFTAKIAIKAFEDKIFDKIFDKTDVKTSLVIYFVPVSEQYNKKSVKTDCLPNSDEDRMKMLQLVAAELNGKNDKIFVKVTDLEMKWDEDQDVITMKNSNDRFKRGKDGSVNTDASLKVLLHKIRNFTDNQNIKGGVLFGQDNIEAIVQDKWGDGTPFLEEQLICIPRGGDSNSIINNLINMVNIEDKKGLYKGLIEKIIVISTDTITQLEKAEKVTNPDFDLSKISSTEVRKLLYGYGYGNADDPSEIELKRQILQIVQPQILDYILDKGLYKPEKSIICKGGRSKRRNKITKKRKTRKTKTRRSKHLK